ncbi:MAG TPA: TlpA disulfide reductase family protein, partial [Blastocatellia bacterium]|nr:TlpA disulfide reductase family protein [Blastocatellia bacterium]
MRLLLMVSVCLLAILFSSCGDGTDRRTVEVGGAAPGFSLKSLDGETVTSKSLEGNVVVLNFWATWCAPCLKEIPDLNQVASRSDVTVVGIALDEDGVKTVRRFVEQHRVNY